MDPNSASVYTETWSTMTWVLILTGIVLSIIALVVAFIVLEHRACQLTATPHPEDGENADDNRDLGAAEDRSLATAPMVAESRGAA